MSEKIVKDALSEIFEQVADGLETGSFGKKIRVGITILGSEHGPEEVIKGAKLAQNANADIQVVAIGAGVNTDLEMIEIKDEKEAHDIMDKMLVEGNLDAAVTMHYSFPIGVSTVGRVITPGFGKEMLLANTTGTTATERISAMLKNTIGGIAVAKAQGIDNPSVGLLNIEGARQVERFLNKLQESGYNITFSESARADGGVVMRGNDLLQGVPDVMVMDSLTGNVMMKVFSSYTTGGSFEALGYGYGPGVGEGYDRIINIISRASGAPVISKAIRFAADMAKGNLLDKVNEEYKAVKKAGWDKMLASFECPKNVSKNVSESVEITQPPKKTVTADIPGIEILDLEDAVQILWKKEIYAESGMGCTGPIIMIANEDKEKAIFILKENNYL